MAEYHKTVTTSSPTLATVLWEIYQCVTNASNTYIEIAVDATDVSATCVDDGAGGHKFATPTSAADFVADSYIVIQPTADYPGGGRWQCKLQWKDSITKLTSELALDGVWDSTGTTAAWNAPGSFSGVTTGSSGLSSQDTGSLSSVTKMYLSSVAETYDVNKTYYYFRMLLREGGGDCHDAFYVGGYAPFDSTADAKPVCTLAHYPTVGTGEANEWADSSSTVNKTASDYAHTGTTSCWVDSITSMQTGGAGDDRAGNYIAPTCYLIDGSSNVLGTFGARTFRGFDTSIADWSLDSSGDYIVTGSFLHRFNE